MGSVSVFQNVEVMDLFIPINSHVPSGILLFVVVGVYINPLQLLF